MKILQLALREGKPAIVVYQGKKGITQRRVYVRSITEERVTVYCTQKKGIRVFQADGILAARIADEG
ncbi:MAG: hypothetical protein VB082_10930 [Christensenella sp.]|nr:hypothetical protein [Christensenella sp.]